MLKNDKSVLKSRWSRKIVTFLIMFLSHPLIECTFLMLGNQVQNGFKS